MTEREEAFMAVCDHYGLKALLMEIDDILDNIKTGCMAVPLANDPQIASMQLYRERMKYEGALALKQSLIVKIKEAKKQIQKESAR